MSGLIGHHGLLFGGGGGAPPGASTWNPADKDADVALSGGDLIATLGVSNGGAVRSVNARDAAGDWYAEIALGGSSLVSEVGICTSSSLLDYPSKSADGYSYSPSGDDTYSNDSNLASDILAGASGAQDVLGVLVNFTAGTITLRRAGKFYSESFASIGGTLYPMWGPGTAGAGTRSATINTGGSAFFLGLPAGATAWGGTWNSADKSGNITLSGSDLVATINSGGGSVRGTQGRSSGIYYFEITRGGDSVWLGGVGNASASLATYPGGDANGWAYYHLGDHRYNNNSGSAMPAQMASAVIGVWLKAGVLKIIGDGQVSPNVATGLSGNKHLAWGAGTVASGTRTGTANLAGPFNWQPAGSTAWG
jgi:hypothetical protein